MDNFKTLGLPEVLLQALTEQKFEVPTEIQKETIPAGIKGQDILGSAQTGTGKTLAYGIVLLSYLINNPESRALIMAPTRELASQVLTALKQVIGKRNGIFGTLLIGGDSMFRQVRELKGRTKPRFIVGTPGRINDHLERGTLSLSDAPFLVLDEMDRMLDMGFAVQIQEIIRQMPEKRQTLMFSATMSPDIIRHAQAYLVDPLRVSVGSTRAPSAAITQETLKVSESDKYQTLLNQLESHEGSVIIFVKTKYGTERLADKLQGAGYGADAIHGDLRQRNRERVIRAFRNKEHRILVATDVAARGLDIPHIECVINYDLPQCPEDYIHRIGRTGRAGAEGVAVNLVTPQESGKWRDICRLIDPKEAQAPSSSRMGAYPAKNRGRGGDWKSDFKKPKREFRGEEFGRRSAEGESRPFRNNGGSSFKPRGQEQGSFRFKPRGEGAPTRSFKSADGEGAPRFKRREEGAGHFKARDEGGAGRFKARDEGFSRFKPRDEGAPRRFKSRDEGSSAPRQFKPREDGSAPRQFKSRDDRGGSRPFKGNYEGGRGQGGVARRPARDAR